MPMAGRRRRFKILHMGKRKWNGLQLAGLAVLVVASVTTWAVRREGGDGLDGPLGVLYGISLGLLLLGLRGRIADGRRAE